MKYFDISPLLSSKTAVFPGDTVLTRRVALDFKKGHNLLLSSIQTTLHLGAHADAPNHYSPEGADMASVPLDKYLGAAQVVEIKKAAGSRILWSDFKHLEVRAPRILFKTLSFSNPDEWRNDFVALSAELIRELGKRGVQLVGIDTPSIDLADDKVLESHSAVFDNSMGILEGLVLNEVPSGLYTLIALPLRLQGADASPVRAILLEKEIV